MDRNGKKVCREICKLVREIKKKEGWIIGPKAYPAAVRAGDQVMSVGGSEEELIEAISKAFGKYAESPRNHELSIKLAMISGDFH